MPTPRPPLARSMSRILRHRSSIVMWKGRPTTRCEFVYTGRLLPISVLCRHSYGCTEAASESDFPKRTKPGYGCPRSAIPLRPRAATQRFARGQLVIR